MVLGFFLRFPSRCYQVALEEIGEVFNARDLASDIMQALTEAGPQENLLTK